MKVLDLFCGGGGVAEAFIEARHEVSGIDINLNCRKYYPGSFFHQDLKTMGLKTLMPNSMIGEAVPPPYVKFILEHIHEH